MNRKSLKDQKRDNALSMRYYARLSDKPDPEIPEGSVKRGPRVRNPDDEPLEGAEQAAVVSWWYHYSKTVPCDYRLLIAIPNAQKLMAFATNRHAFMQSLRNEGFRDGAPDLILLMPSGTYNGMLVEMKRRTKGVISPVQQEMLTITEAQGYKSVIARGADEAIMHVKRYLHG